jgi:plasmid stability protein
MTARPTLKNLTIRNVPEELHKALRREKNRRGKSLNQAVIDLLSERLAVGTTRSNGLARLAGRWTEDEFRRFEEATALFENTDKELWR